MTRNRFITAICKVISIAAHPWLVLTYLAGLLFFGNTIAIVIPVKFRIASMGTIIVCSAILPVISTLLFRASNMTLGRNRSMMPITITLLCYVTALILSSNFASAVFPTKNLLYTAIACAGFALTVNIAWKISLYMIGWGALTAAIAIFTFSGMGRLWPELLTAIIISGVVGSTRLYLGSHTLTQVGAGFAGGFAIAYLMLSITI